MLLRRGVPSGPPHLTRSWPAFSTGDPAASNKLAGVDDSGTPASATGRTAS